MEHYKFIILIIDSDSDPVYASFREIIRKYMNTYPNDIKSFFIRRSSDIHELTVQGDTIYTHGEENFIPGIFEKTIHSMDFCLKNYSFDFLIRTNMSSFLNYHCLLEKYATFSRNKFVCAVRCVYNNIPFPSGAFGIMSRDVVNHCVMNYEKGDRYKYYDDVVLGQLIGLQGVDITYADRFQIMYYTNKNVTVQEIMNSNPSSHYHYRVKGDIKDGDANVYQMLYDIIYGSST